MKNFYLILTLAFAFFSKQSFCQVYNLGGPVSFKLKNELKEDYDVHIMPSFDLTAQLAEDEITTPTKSVLSVLGGEHIVNLSLDNSGIWDELSNGDKFENFIHLFSCPINQFDF